MSVRHTAEAPFTTLTEPFLLAFGVRNDFIHVYQDAQALLADRDIGAGVGEHPVALEFYDSAGKRYAGKYGPQWQLLELVPSADPPDPERLHQRVQAVGERLQSFVRERPDVLALYGLSEGEALAVFASPSRTESSGILGAVWPFAAGGGEFPSGVFGDEDDQGIWHNITHHLRP